MAEKDTPRLSRLIALLTQLQSKKILTATEIARKFSISVRTVYRDIRMLEQAGVPIFMEEGKGYSLIEGYRLPPATFTENEANAFITAEKLVLLNRDASLVKNYTEGIMKLKAVMKNDIRDKVSLLSQRVEFWQAANPQKEPSSLLSNIQIALTNFSIVKIEYYSLANDEITTRHVEPFALINNVGDEWYLIAWCRLRNDFRLFRFDRIRDFEITGNQFAPHKITLNQYLQDYRNYVGHP